MKRRQFITCFGATVAANTLSWSRAARAQQSAMPSGPLPSSAKPDNPANGLDPLLQQAQTLGAPMAAVARAITISHQQTFAKKDALAVFDISQPSASKRFYLFDFKSGEVTALLCGAWKIQWTQCESRQIQRLPKRFRYDAVRSAQDSAFRSHGPLQDHRRPVRRYGLSKHDRCRAPGRYLLSTVTLITRRRLNGSCIQTGTPPPLTARKIMACWA